MTDIATLFKIAIALFAIVNPIGSLPIFISATDGWSAADREKTAKTVAMTVFIVLSVSAFLGDKILSFFGINIPSFQVGGGILIMLVAISMMHGKIGGTRQTQEEAESLNEREVIAIVPLSIPLLAGPGAIGSMIISAQQNPSFAGHISLMLPISIIALTIWIVLRLSVKISEKLGTIGINIVTRLMGLILAAMAVEFITQGLIGIFPLLGQ